MGVVLNTSKINVIDLHIFHTNPKKELLVNSFFGELFFYFASKFVQQIAW